MPHGCEDIGAWQGAFEVIVMVGTISNSALIVFTMGMFAYEPMINQVWYFICMQWAMFTILSVNAKLVADVPYGVKIQKARVQYFKDTLIQLQAPASMFL